MIALCSLVAALAVTASPKDLDAAESAFKSGDYEAVLPHVEKALTQALTPEQRIRAWEIAALTHSAFDRAADAVQAFRHLLFVDPRWQPRKETSPKVRAYFDKARSLGPLPDPNAPRAADRWLPSASAATAPAPAASGASNGDSSQVGGASPLYSRWWFWAGVSAVAVGAAGVTYAATRPQIPEGSLGTGALRR